MVYKSVNLYKTVTGGHTKCYFCGFGMHWRKLSMIVKKDLVYTVMLFRTSMNINCKRFPRVHLKVNLKLNLQ